MMPTTGPRSRNSPSPLCGLLALLASLLLSSCARHYVLTTPGDLSQLPTRYGWRGETVAALTPWQYVGSHYRTHEFRYHFNRDNPLYYRDVSVARDRSVLQFEEHPYGKSRQWVTLQYDGEYFYFSPVPPRH